MKKTTKFLSVFLALLMIISIIPMSSITASAGAASGSCGENLTWTFNESTGTLTISGTGEMYDRLDYDSYEYPWENIKESIETVIFGDGVTTISGCAFYECFNIKEVTMSDSVTFIDELAFYSCENMTEIVLSENIETIGSDAFGWCCNLTEIVLPNSLVSIGNYAFCHCCNLTNIIIPDNVLYIHDGAFSTCWNLQTVEFSDNLLEIGSEAFNGCYFTSISIPQSVTYIGGGAFIGCPVTSIDVDEGNTCYLSDEYGVLFNKDMTELIQYPNGNKRTEYVIPDTVEVVGEYAFNENFYLTTVTVPNSVIRIEDFAFYCCSVIRTISIPASVEIIGEEVFNGCDRLTSITVDKNNLFYSSDSIGVLFDKNKTVLIQYPKGNEQTSYRIPNSVTKIADCAFNGSRNITEVVIPDSVTSIGIQAFEFSHIECITIPDSVTEIGDHAFYTSALTSVTIGNGITEIPYGLFMYCDDLTEITIPDSVSTIAEYAFHGCDNLTNVYFEGSEDGWEYVSIDIDNESLTNATIHYGMENALNGDTSGDREITLLDSQYALQHICGAERLHNTYVAAADVNDDRNVTAFDARLISLYASGLIDNLNVLPVVPDDSNYKSISIHYSKKELKAGDRLLIAIEIPEFSDIATLDFSFEYNDTIFDVIDWNTYSLFDEERVNNNNLGEEMFMFDITGEYLARCGNIRYSGYSVDSVNIGGTVLQIELEASVDITDVNQVYCYMLTQEITDANYNSFDVSGNVFWGSDDTCEHIATTITIPESCTVDGMEYDVCETCGETIGTPTILPATGHTPGEWKVTVEPTYEATGMKIRQCIICGETFQTEVIPMLIKTTITDENTGVSMEYNEDDYFGDVDIVVEEAFDGTAFDVIDSSLNASQKFIYDITMTVDGEAIQPNGSVTIKIPLPSGYDPDRSFIYYVNTENGTVEKMPARYENGYLVFETTHFSYYAVVEEHNYTFSIQTPSKTEIRHKDGIKLHTNIEGTAPAGSYVVWTASNDKFKTEEINNGNSLKIISDKNGTTTFTATLYSANGELLATDTIEMKSKAGFFDKLGSFFRSLFGTTKTYES